MPFYIIIISIITVLMTGIFLAWERRISLHKKIRVGIGIDINESTSEVLLDRSHTRLERTRKILIFTGTLGILSTIFWSIQQFIVMQLVILFGYGVITMGIAEFVYPWNSLILQSEY